MNLADIMFYIFGAQALVFGAAVALNPFARNPILSVLSLLLTLLACAGLFILAGAYFLAAVQILLYAGAVVVLYLLVTSLLGHERPGSVRRHRTVTILAIFTAAVFAAVMTGLVRYVTPAGAMHGGPSLNELGKALFDTYLLPFEIVSVIILAAIVVVVHLTTDEER